MKRFSKVSFDDIKTIQVDSGVLLKGFDVENPIVLQENVICATSGGINPVCAPEYYDFGEDVDNAKPSKETKRIRGWNATISFTTLTTSLAAIKLALGAADISGKVLNLRQRLQYAKDFKDIWWVGKRADDKLIAIRLIRSLSDSGFSLQTNKRGKGQISVTLKGHSSFTDIKKVPMEIYVFAESDIPVTPDEPVTSEMYLYGTPSTTGNIGLRVGESVTYYDGAVLPPLPEWDKTKYPYAHISYTNHYLHGPVAHLTFQSEPLAQIYSLWERDGKYKHYILVEDMEATKDITYDGVPYSDIISAPNEWSLAEENDKHYTTSVMPWIWANYDMVDKTGSVYVPKSNPVPVSGLVGNSYNGTVLPELPETDLPYAVMAIQKLSDTWFVARLFLCAECPTCGYWYANAVAKGDDLKVSGEVAQYVLYNDIEINSIMTFDVSTANVWEHMETKTYNAETQKLWDDSEAIWTNTDILYSGHRTEADGGVFIAKSDPIPVYK